ncbi:hypothetical protein ACIA03_03505 [Nocardioides sp. NPDC051685]|uniref:hypothetical protein n=1 Tax=Nocardioides sp. NPDC051685 TaxID=3364334 RepID=UPI0037BD4FCB
MAFGCEDGALLYRDGAFEKLHAPDEYGRMGNAYVSEDLAYILATDGRSTFWTARRGRSPTSSEQPNEIAVG